MLANMFPVFAHTLLMEADFPKSSAKRLQSEEDWRLVTVNLLRKQGPSIARDVLSAVQELLHQDEKPGLFQVSVFFLSIFYLWGMHHWVPKFWTH